MPHEAYFTKDLFAVLSDLAAHNSREWFHANRARYEASVKAGLLRFVTDFEPRLKGLSPHYVASPASIMRPNRDMRFATEGGPYKTMAGALFKHERAKDVLSSPGFMLHLEPGNSFAGIGLRGPDPRSQARVREAIVADPDTWKKVIGGKAFQARCALSPESLSRPPRGFDASHPCINDLKRRHYCTITPFTEREVCGSDFLDRYVDLCRLNAPLMSFLSRALNLDW